jgi:antitoxin (DNA-binding transcriptional repressor) of toxin-antitoxin stability system
MWSVMKTATVRDLRNRCTRLLGWIGEGEEIVITRRGKAIARLVPEQDALDQEVDWSQSLAVKRVRSRARQMTAGESLQTVRDAGGKW